MAGLPRHRSGRLAKVIAGTGSLYLLLPLVVFDFTSVAVPYDEETFGAQSVAIGPLPRWWIPGAAHDLDIPGGFGYDEQAWPFRLWKPICVAYVRGRGFALPAAWR